MRFFFWNGWFETPGERHNDHHKDSQYTTVQRLTKQCAVHYCAATNEPLCTVQYSTVQCLMKQWFVQCSIVQCSSGQNLLKQWSEAFSAALCSAVQHSAVKCSAKYCQQPFQIKYDRQRNPAPEGVVMLIIKHPAYGRHQAAEFDK